MSFTTYAGLQAAVADQLARGDLTTQIPDFVTLFEAEAARELFRMRPTETTTTLTTTSGDVSLPSDYMGWRRLTWTGSVRQELEYAHPSVIQSFYPTQASGIPAHFTIEGTTLKVMPSDDSTPLEFDYFAKTGALASALNWLFTNHPDAYFFGALEQAYLFVKDADNATVNAAKKLAVFNSIKMQRFREDGALVIRSVGNTP